MVDRKRIANQIQQRMKEAQASVDYQQRMLDATNERHLQAGALALAKSDFVRSFVAWLETVRLDDHENPDKRRDLITQGRVYADAILEESAASRTITELEMQTASEQIRVMQEAIDAQRRDVTGIR